MAELCNPAGMTAVRLRVTLRTVIIELPPVPGVRVARTSAYGAVAIRAGKRPEVLVVRFQGRL